MKIVVFGASGRIGSRVVSILATKGYRVKAFIHSEPHERVPNVEYIQGDIYQSHDVATAIGGTDAVVSCLGSWGTPKKDILTAGMHNIVPAMKSHGVTRLVSLTGADAWTEVEKPTGIQKVMHAIFGRLAHKILRDGEAHLRIVSQSRLDWTVLRSPVMNEKGSSDYMIKDAYPMPWRTIHRNAVATALCDQLEDHGFCQKAPFLYRR